jgi:Icc-related predicted phosphoesterase
LYYAGDIHGSDVLWRKFINASSHYGVDALVMGGDITGKGLIPIIEEDGHYTARIIGERRVARTDEELRELEKAISMNGMYSMPITSGEYERLRTDEQRVHELFNETILQKLRGWIELADERLADSDVRAYVIPGNDDPWSVDAVLATGSRVIACDDAVTEVNGHEMMSLGYSNITPWKTPRELDEDELYSRVRRLADQLQSPRSAIMNLHVPPHNSGLDTAFEVDDDLSYVTKGGQPHEVSIGSPAVRQIIEEVQPALSLHGHVHESKGITRIGRTWAINPGSDYPSGNLEGTVVDLAGDEVTKRLLVRG